MYTVLYTITTQNKLFDGAKIDDPEMKLMYRIFKNRSL